MGHRLHRDSCQLREGLLPGGALAAQGHSSGMKSANLRHSGCSGSPLCSNQHALAGACGGSGLKRLEEAMQHPRLCLSREQQLLEK